MQEILPKLGYRWPGFRKVRSQVCRRIHRRMQELDINSYEKYNNYIRDHEDELNILDRMLDITITRFWRDRGVFELIGKKVFPDLISSARRENRTHLHCWSAGCCNGEEAYSLLLLWHVRLAPENMHLRITATDRNETVLERARKGFFPEGVLRDVPIDIVNAGFDKSNSGYTIKKHYVDKVRFVQQDIRHEIPEGHFDIILCRNLVFTYFDTPVRDTIMSKILSRLRQGGYFIIGSNEQLSPKYVPLKQIKKGEPVYRYRP